MKTNFRLEIKWAILFILMTLAWMVLEKLCGLHGQYIDYHMYLTNLYMIPAIWIMVLALKDIKKKNYQGQITYKQGFVAGLILSLLIAFMSPFAQWIISYIITPEYFPNVIKRSVELGYFKSTTEAEATFNYKNYAIQSTIAALVMGTVTTAVAMLFLKSKNN